MNYAEISDIEINKAVAMKVAKQRRNSGLPYAVIIPFAKEEPPMVRSFDKQSWDEVPGFKINNRFDKFNPFKRPEKAKDEGEDCDKIKIFDPCNSWADARPIIEKNRIGIEHDGDCWLCTCFSENGAFESEHDNPLRAAMIVFLMMEGK